MSFLVGQQCGNGGFPETFGASPCVATVDATGFAVQALTAVGGKAGLAAAADGGRWLKRQQHGNGSFTGNGARNANSTALAAQALTAVGRDNAAADARGFLRDLQVGCAGKAANRGMVRYARGRRGRLRPCHQPGDPRAGAGHPGRHQPGRRRPRPAQAGLLARC